MPTRKKSTKITTPEQTKPDTRVLEEFLKGELKIEFGGSNQVEPEPPTCQVSKKCIGPWLWILVRTEIEGRKWDQTTDRASGDPFSKENWWDWIGLAENAPAKVTCLEELDNWALYTTSYVIWYRDVQYPAPWGDHSGRWVENITEDGKVTVRRVAKRSFHDVSPITMTMIEHVSLNEIKKSKKEISKKGKKEAKKKTKAKPKKKPKVKKK
ncbi:MAG: hypothetical protein HWN67_16220 [Candidatus Helarchaeota archaeon]|nr:hypothetical protein [Candidatus Helarchaeota archaeon]